MSTRNGCLLVSTRLVGLSHSLVASMDVVQWRKLQNIAIILGIAADEDDGGDIIDPDSVLFDGTGAHSGTPGSVLVGGTQGTTGSRL